MNRSAKTVLTVIALCVLAAPVKAEEKVWHCEIKRDLTIFGHMVRKEEPLSRFILVVSGSDVRIPRNNFTTLDPLQFDLWFDETHWTASNSHGSVHFKKGAFSFVRQDAGWVLAIIAECEDF